MKDRKYYFEDEIIQQCHDIESIYFYFFALGSFFLEKQKLIKLHFFKASTCEVCARVNVCVWVWD